MLKLRIDPLQCFNKNMENLNTYEEEWKGNPYNLLLANKLTYIGDLLPLLGYSDYRAAESFCRSNNIPLIKVGKKKYIVSMFLDLYIQNQIQTEINSSYANSIEMLDAVINDDVDALSVLSKDEGDTLKTRPKRIGGGSSNDFLNKIKQA